MEPRTLDTPSHVRSELGAAPGFATMSRPAPLRVILWCFTACAVGLYFYRLDALCFTVDEIYHGIAARSIVEHGRPVLPDGSLYLKGALFSYLGATLLPFTGSVELAVRSVSAVSLLVCGLLVWRLVRILSQREEAALLAAFVWFFHPWTIEFARWGRLYTLAALLLTWAVLCLARFEMAGRRSALFWALGLLGVMTTLFPFGLWVWLVFAAYGWWRLREAQPERLARIEKRALPVVVGLGLVLAALAGHELWTGRGVIGGMVATFTGFTGNHSGVSLRQFFGFSPYYPKFFFGELHVLGLSLLPLAVVTWRDRRDKRLQRLYAVLVLITLGGACFVTFVHLKQRAPRYLFPIFPLTVVAAVVCWTRIVAHLSAKRARLVYAVAGVLCGVWFVRADSFQIPFRKHGDAYPNRSFISSPYHKTHENLASPARFVRAHRGPNDVVISNRYQYYFFYGGEEPDYAIKPRRGVAYGQRSAYMSRTRQLANYRHLRRAIRDSKGRTVWLIADLNDTKVRKYLDELSDVYQVVQVFQDPDDDRARVFRIDGDRNGDRG